MPKTPLILALLAFLTTPVLLHAAEPAQTAQTFEKEITRTLELDYLLYLPENYERKKKEAWPLVLFLHGAGERGDDLELVKKHGPPKLIEEGKSFPFIVVSPQSPEDAWWDHESLAALLEDIEKRYRVNPDRIYVTGLSMGGFGTWDLAVRYPEKFAAVAPICGGGSPYRTRRIKHLPVWVFHGAQDKAVPIAESEKMVAALKKSGSTKVKFTVYPEAGHDSWTETYDNPELYEWLLAHSRE